MSFILFLQVNLKDYLYVPEFGKAKEYVVENVKVPESIKVPPAVQEFVFTNAKSLNSMFTLERCPKNNKPEVCAANLWKLRSWFIAGAIGTGFIGAKALPLIGFDVSGVVPQSIAAAWQSSIGNVAAGSLFSILQSLGATGSGVLLTGSVTAGLTALGGLVVEKKLDWCTCQYDEEIKKSKL